MSCTSVQNDKEFPHDIVKYKKRYIIFEEGDESRFLYRLKSGCVMMHIHGKHGDRRVLRFVMPGEFFGFCPDRHRFSAEAIVNVCLQRFSIHKHDNSEIPSSDLFLFLLSTATDDLRNFAGHIQRVLSLPAVERVKDFYRWLDAHEDQLGASGGRAPMSQRDIADYLGIAPETLSRCLKQCKLGLAKRRSGGSKGIIGEKASLRKPQLPAATRRVRRQNPILL